MAKIRLFPRLPSLYTVYCIFRFMMAHHTNIGQSVTQMLRVCQAYRHSDLTGEITPAGWQKGGEVIPADYSAKIAYYENKYGGKNAGIVSKESHKC